MYLHKLFYLSVLSATAAFCQMPSGWKVIHDKTGSCQIGVPGDWTVSKDLNWMGQAPGNQGDLQLVSQAGKTVKPFNEATQKVLMVNKMIENSPKLVFYSNEPTKGDHPITPYRALVPAKDGACAAMVSVRAGVSEDVVKKIVATLSAAH